MTERKRVLTKELKEALHKRGYFDMTSEELVKRQREFLKRFKDKGDPEDVKAALRMVRRGGCHDRDS
ncbi:MAG TPA: hypothetical protein VGL40_07870 [Bacillota bacterium]